MQKIILASASKARKLLMDRLLVNYQAIPADIDESAYLGEPHDDYVRRMSQEKANKLAEKHSNAIVIGSDAIASIQGTILGKPLTFDNAVEQLKLMSGNRVDFLTGLCVIDTASKQKFIDLVVTQVYFKTLNFDTIEYYLHATQPYASAGSLHSEGLGIILMERWIGPDPTALMGLPLIRLCHYLSKLNALIQK